jgi:hypothetical protein
MPSQNPITKQFTSTLYVSVSEEACVLEPADPGDGSQKTGQFGSQGTPRGALVHPLLTA